MSNATAFWLRIDGWLPAAEVAAHSPITWETRASGGSFRASWVFNLTPRSQHQALAVDALVEIMCGPLPVWAGTLAYPDRSTWECTAYGFAAKANQYLALDGTGTPTRDVGVAITQAIARGWNVSNPAGYGVGATAVGSADGNPVTLGSLLDDYAKQLGQRWGVDGRRRIYFRTDPTSPNWLASPEATAFGVTNEDRAKTLAGRYLDSTTSAPATAFAGSGAPEADVDLSDRGAMSFVEAGVVLGGMLALGKSETVWTNGVTLTEDQLTTMGGSRAFLPGVRGGQLMRSFGLPYTTNALSLDTVIDLTRYTQGERQIYVEPVNLAETSAPFGS